VACFERTRSGFVEFRVGPNPGVVAQTVSGLLRWSEGQPDAARRHLADAVRLARDLDHPYSVAYALHHATLLDLWRHDLDSVAHRAQESLDLCEVYDYPVWRALATILHGTARVGTGQPAAGLAEVEQGFAMYRELQTPPVFWPQLMMVRANAYGMAGQVDRALDLMGEADDSLAHQDPLAGELAIARGDLLLATSDPDLGEATALFERAASIAVAQGARMNELIALTRLVRLGRDGDGGDGPRDRLRAVYDSFTEGFDAHPLVDARAVLGIG
jgi:hypothetical protein